VTGGEGTSTGAGAALVAAAARQPQEASAAVMSRADRGIPLET
jgi:hypothetical protein